MAWEGELMGRGCGRWKSLAKTWFDMGSALPNATIPGPTQE